MCSLLFTFVVLMFRICVVFCVDLWLVFNPKQESPRNCRRIASTFPVKAVRDIDGGLTAEENNPSVRQCLFPTLIGGSVFLLH